MRVRRRGIYFSWADFFIVLAWCIVVIEVGIDAAEWHHGFFTRPNPFLPGHRPKDALILKLIYWELSLYFIMMYSIKFSLLCLYKEIIPRSMTKAWYCMWVVAGFTVASFIVSQSMKMFWCIPISRNWDPNDTCISGADFTVGLVTTILHVSTDLMIYALPLPLLRQLKLTRRQTYGLWFTLGIGFLCIAFCFATALLSLYSAETTTCWIIVIFEYFWANMVVCLPAFKNFLKAKVISRVRGRSGRSDEDKSGSAPYGSAGTLTRATRTSRVSVGLRSPGPGYEEIYELKKAEEGDRRDVSEGKAKFPTEEVMEVPPTPRLAAEGPEDAYAR